MNEHYISRRIRRREHERGSALLIVFVLAAIIAIMLYREMPVAAFEARRQKEQTLVDRGHEYQRAVQLYYRKFQGRYPANIDMLENTNSMRFLRRRYVDPFTGKDDWRLLHAGPGGMLMDSKVQNLNQNGIFGQNGTNNNSSNTTLGSGFSGGGARNGFGSDSSSFGSANSTGTASSSTSSFGSSSFGSSDSSSSSDPAVVVPPVVKRAPVMAANGTPTSSELDQDPSVPLLPADDSSASQGTDAASRAQSGTAENGAAIANQTAGPAGANQAGTGPNSMQMVQNMFASGANQPQAQTNAAAMNSGTGTGTGITSTTGSTGNISSGSLAGVASKAKGHTIKKINDQTDYSLWEFWYDPTKDKSMGTVGGGAQQNGNGGQNVQNGTQLGQPANSTFGSTGSSFNSNQSTTQTPAAGTQSGTDTGTGTTATPTTQPQ